MTKVIIEMGMPKDCPMCPMAHYNKLDEFTGCDLVSSKRYAMVMDKAYAESACRPDWCPIKGVLPDEHGDLIDRSLLCADLAGVILWHSGLGIDKVIARQNAVIAAERRSDEQG